MTFYTLRSLTEPIVRTTLAPILKQLARDHAFTFLDHSLRHRNSLVGLSCRQTTGFYREPQRQRQFSSPHKACLSRPKEKVW